jgi:CRP-like cAMP-binding protein
VNSALQADTYAIFGTRRLLRLLSGTRCSFQSLTLDEQYALDNITFSFTSVGPHTDVVREGEGSDRLMIITEGWASRYMTTTNGGRLLSSLLLPGDAANLNALLFERPHYGVRTITQATIVALPCKQMSMLAAEHPGIASALARLGFIENAIVSQQALSVGRRSATERIAQMLCELSTRLDAESGRESSYAFSFTQEVIGDVLGLTAVHVNRTMRALQADGLITLKNRWITIPDASRLRQLCGFDPSYLHMALLADA